VGAVVTAPGRCLFVIDLASKLFSTVVVEPALSVELRARRGYQRLLRFSTTDDFKTTAMEHVFFKVISSGRLFGENGQVAYVTADTANPHTLSLDVGSDVLVDLEVGTVEGRPAAIATRVLPIAPPVELAERVGDFVFKIVKAKLTGLETLPTVIDVYRRLQPEKRLVADAYIEWFREFVGRKLPALPCSITVRDTHVGLAELLSPILGTALAESSLEPITAAVETTIAERTECFEEDPDGFLKEGWMENERLIRDTCRQYVSAANVRLQHAGSPFSFQPFQTTYQGEHWIWSGRISFVWWLLTNEQAEAVGNLGIGTTFPKAVQKK
jgi:hypothetical protein